VGQETNLLPASGRFKTNEIGSADLKTKHCATLPEIVGGDRKRLDAIGGYNFEAKQAPACYIEAMKPSVALDAHREEIRRIVAANRGRNPRVFGSALHRDDTEASDLDLLIDAAEGMTLFDKAAIEADIERLTHTKVDVKTPEDLSVKFRSKVIAEARPV